MSKYVFDINQPAGLLNPDGGESGASLLAGLNNNFDELYKGSGVVYNIQSDDNISDVAWWTTKLETYSIFSVINDYDFLGNTLNLPGGVTLAFNGGVWSNGTINGSNSCFVVNGPIQAFDTDLDITGSWKNTMILPQYYGAINNPNKITYENDCSAAMQKCVDSIFAVYASGFFYFSSPITITKAKTIYTNKGHVDGETPDHTRFYTDQDVHFCIIQEGNFFFIGGGVIDFSGVAAHTHGAFVWDMDYFVVVTEIEAKIIGNLSTLNQIGNGTTAYLFDELNATGNGEVYHVKLTGEVHYCKYGIYSPLARVGRTQSNYLYIHDYDFYVHGCKQSYCFYNGVGLIVRGFNQGVPNTLDASELDLPVMYLGSATQGFTINVAMIDYGAVGTNNHLIYNYGLGHTFLGWSRGISNASQIYNFNGVNVVPDYSTQIPRVRIGHMKSSSGNSAAVSILSNIFANLSPAEVAWTIDAYDGTGYDFDTNLDESNALDPALNLDLNYPDNLLKIEGVPTNIKWTNEASRLTDFIEIVIPWTSVLLNLYYNIASNSNYGQVYRIQTILKTTLGDNVTNIYPAIEGMNSQHFYFPFEVPFPQLFTSSSGLQKIIIRFIGCNLINATNIIQEIYAQSIYFESTFLHKGGGQTIYGNLAVNDGVKEVDLPVYADNAAAKVGGLVAGDPYRTATGVRMVVYD